MMVNGDLMYVYDHLSYMLQLPYYKDGKVNMSQTHAILRYLGIKHGLGELC